VLRGLLGEPKRDDSGLLMEVLQAIESFAEQVEHPDGPLAATSGRARRPPDRRRLWLWAQGFVTALDELEESKHASECFRRNVRSRSVEEMDGQERDDYRRHVYFFKNAFIRVFSILDKLGYFLNEMYRLRTESVKPRFSYYTVLRRLSELKAQPELERQLYELKIRYQGPMQRLRALRNMEIHWINAELMDDWQKLYTEHYDRLQIENLQANHRDLEQGYEMVCLSLKTAFVHILRDVASGRWKR